MSLRDNLINPVDVEGLTKKASLIMQEIDKTLSVKDAERKPVENPTIQKLASVSNANVVDLRLNQISQSSDYSGQLRELRGRIEKTAGITETVQDGASAEGATKPTEPVGLKKALLKKP